MSIETRPNGHDHDTAGFGTAAAQCPYCGHPISRKEFREIQARMRDEERARVAEVERGLQDKFARETAKVAAAKKTEIEKAKKDAAAAADQQVKVLKASLETAIAERVANERACADKRVGEAVAAERTRAYAERMQLDAQLADLQRRLQRRTANELGDEGEIDLFEALMTAFPQDQIARTPKGVEGGDVIQRVFSAGAMVGALVYEAKNHRRWMSKWPAKLRQDQLAAEADHCVLVTSAFPTGASQLAIIEGVVVCSPARAVAVADILRRVVIQAHRLKLSNADRTTKVEMLYSFLTSDRAADFWGQIETATDDMIGLDRAETAAHQKTWNRRAELIRAIQAAHNDLTGQIDTIISGDLELEIGHE